MPTNTTEHNCDENLQHHTHSMLTIMHAWTCKLCSIRPAVLLYQAATCTLPPDPPPYFHPLRPVLTLTHLSTTKTASFMTGIHWPQEEEEGVERSSAPSGASYDRYSTCAFTLRQQTEGGRTKRCIEAGSRMQSRRDKERHLTSCCTHASSG